MRRITWSTLALVAALSVVMPALAQDEEVDPTEAMLALAAPGEQHEMLGKMVGDWTYSQKMWMVPGAPPIETTGTMQATALLDGRFVRATWKSMFMGQEFTGIGINGYDNQTKQFTNVWMDSMGTGMMMFAGQCTDDSCSSTDMSATFPDPMSGQEMSMQIVSTWVDDDHMNMESHLIMADGTKFKNMEISATRAAE